MHYNNKCTWRPYCCNTIKKNYLRIYRWYRCVFKFNKKKKHIFVSSFGQNSCKVKVHKPIGTRCAIACKFKINKSLQTHTQTYTTMKREKIFKFKSFIFSLLFLFYFVSCGCRLCTFILMLVEYATSKITDSKSRKKATEKK